MSAEIKNKRLHITQPQELKILRKIVEITNSDFGLDLILKEVVKVVTEFTAADSVFIYLFDEKTQQFVLTASKTAHQKELGRIYLKEGEGITGWVAREHKPVAIEKNAYQDKRFKGFDLLPEDRYEAFLSVPVLFKKKAIGVINVQHKKPHDYVQTTIDLISNIGILVGGVIEHARLFEESKTKAAQFDSLVKVSKTITSERYLDEILSLIVVVTAEMLNSKICSIMLLDEKGEELAIKATQSLSEDYKKKPNIKVNDESISGEVIKSKRPITVYDVREETRYRYRDLAVKEELTSMLSVPMILKDKAIGIINIYTQTHHHFAPDEIDILQMVANQAAVAVENTRWMQEALKAKEALETRKLIERAKGVLMRLRNLSEEAAYRLIHKKSMDSCRSMKDIAESIILMDEIQR